MDFEAADDNFMNYQDNWTIPFDDGFRFILTNLYFTFTSLSTVGFGDYYPVNNEERLFASILLLSGVATFSYTMGELNCVLMNTIMADEQVNQIQLDQFFLLLKKLNMCQPINKSIVEEISGFI